MSAVEFFCVRLADFSRWLLHEDLLLECFTDFWMRFLINFDVPLLSVISPNFLTWGSIKHLRGSFLRKRLAEFSRWLFPSESSILDVWQFSESIFSFSFCVVYRYYYLFSVIYFFILYSIALPYLFYCFNWAFLCHHLATFLKLGHFTAYFGQFLYY